MEDERARALLGQERHRVERLLAESTASARENREAANEPGDLTDPAGPLISEEGDDAVVASLRARLEAIGRAERRLDEGTYGRSVRSGAPIPDDRLEADPAAELTIEEAAHP